MAKKRSTKKPSPHSSTSPTAQRLNKVLAAAGLGSRRKVEGLIEQGRVQIDGDVVTDLACKVEPATVIIKVDGELLKKSRPVYYALNKPSGVLSTNYDPSGRMRVIDLVPDRDRVFSVGRLDQSSEGLMLLTNDGELAQRLAHPKFRIQKTYFVVVSGQMTEEELTKLRKGVHLAEGMARIDGASIKRVRKGCTEIEILLSEGKNREIRRILARAGHKVVLLRRIAIGPLRLGQMPVGASRLLTSSEVRSLYAATEAAQRTKKKPEAKTTGKPTSKAPGKPTSKPTGKAGSTLAPAAKVSPPMDVDEDDDDLVTLAQTGALYQNSEVASDEDDVDDDFIGDFSGVGSGGRVLGFDDDPVDSSSSTAAPRGRQPRDSKTRGAAKASTAKGAAAKLGSGGRDSRSDPYAKATAKARTGKTPARRTSSRSGPTAGGKPTSGKSSGGKSTGGRSTGGRSSSSGATSRGKSPRSGGKAAGPRSGGGRSSGRGKR